MKQEPTGESAPDSTQKTEHINVRVSTELKRLMELAAGRDRRSPSEWLRVQLEDLLMQKKEQK